MTKEQQKLVEDNHNLIYLYLKNSNLPVDDYYDLAAIGLCNAALTYDKTSKAKFSTYAYQCIKFEVCKAIKIEMASKRKAHREALSYQMELENNKGDTTCLANKLHSSENVENDAVYNVLFDTYYRRQSDQRKKILTMFKQGYSQYEIAEAVKCKRQWVSQVKMDTVNYIRAM